MIVGSLAPQACMAGQKDDCYFFYNSTCAKGDDCPFRHEPMALGNEITCELWENGKCFRKTCKFRHSVVEKKRSQMACFFETQASGCLKPHCPFLHTKPRPVLPGVDNPTPGVLQPPVARPAQTAGIAQENREQMSIPVIGRGPVPHQPPCPVPFNTRGPPPPLSFNGAPPNPHFMQTMRYPQFGGVPQPKPGPHGYWPGPSGGPAHFDRGGLPPAGYSNVPYPMHVRRDMEGFKPSFPHRARRPDSSSSSDHSSESGDEAGGRSPRHSSRRRADSSRREGGRRVVKGSRRRHQSGDRQHRASEDRKRSRPRSRDKSPDLGKKEKAREQDRKKRSERGQGLSDQESKDKDSRVKDSEDGRKNSGKEATEVKEGEGNVAAGSNSPIIKVKTLEEILREKALKKMEERRAERKADKESDQSGEAAVSESTGQRSAPTNGMRVEDDAEEDSSVRRAGSDGGEPNEGEPTKQEEVGSTTGNRDEGVEAAYTDLGSRQAPPSNDSFKIKTLEEILEEKKRRKATPQANVEQVDSATAKPPPTKPTDKALRGVGSPPGNVSTSTGRRPRKVTSAPHSPPGKVGPSADRNLTKITREPQYAGDTGKEEEETKKSGAVKGRRRIRVTKTAAQPSNTGAQPDSTVAQKQPTTIARAQAESAPPPKQDLRVKTFEEIMQEKRRRRIRAETKDATPAGAAAAATAGPANTQSADKEQPGAPPRKSKSLPVIKSRKIKVVRRPATKSDGSQEGSRPSSPAPASPGLSSTEGPAPEVTGATTTVSTPLEISTTTVVTTAATTTAAAPVAAAVTTTTAAAAATTETGRPEAAPAAEATTATDPEAVTAEGGPLGAATAHTVPAVPAQETLQVDSRHVTPAKKRKTETESAPPVQPTLHAGCTRDLSDEDLDDFFSEAIGNLSPAGSGAHYDDLHEDELMMELDAMLDQ